MPFFQNPGIRNFMVQQQRVAHGGFANLNSMSAPERRAFTGDRAWPGTNNDLSVKDWQREGQSFPQPIHATLNNAAALYKGSDNPASVAAIEQYLEDKGLGDIEVKFKSESGPSRWEYMPSGSRYPRAGASIPYVLFVGANANGKPFRSAVKKSDRPFVEDRGSKLRVDRDMWKELKTEAGDGRGITKKELTAIVDKHANDGRKGQLTKTERASLLRAIDEGLFATRGTAGIAQKVASGGALSLLDIQMAGG